MNAVQQQASQNKESIVELCIIYPEIAGQDTKEKLFRKLIRGEIKQQVDSTAKLFREFGGDFQSWKDSVKKQTKKYSAGVIVDMALSLYQEKSFIWVK